MIKKEHISKKFDADLEEVRTSVLQMGGFVVQQIEQAIEALFTGDEQSIEQVIVNDHRVNAMQVKIDELSCQIIARRQPTAGDLRMIMTVINTITDLERIGDEAAKIARMAKRIYDADRLQVPRFIEIKHIANLTIDMVNKALDAFARLDSSVSAKIVRQDDEVDEEFRSIIRQLITFMMEDPRKISTAIEILFVAKAIERIGDHAKNMSEYVVYMVKGKDVRHISADEIEREVNGNG